MIKNDFFWSEICLGISCISACIVGEFLNLSTTYAIDGFEI